MISDPKLRTGLLIATLFAATVPLAGCDTSQAPDTQPSGDAEATALPGPVASATQTEPTAEPKKSIIRPEVTPSPIAPPPLEPEQIAVRFPDKSDEPDDAGLAAIDTLMASPTFKAGGPITIWGHTDSRGTDTINLKASRKRAEAVRDYLEEKGVAADRMTVIPLGESRPVAPNRNLDGSDNPEGRAKNRRVELRVEPPADEPAAQPTENTEDAADTSED
ncbi:hypothetical protein GCM10011349_06020 [Novosphingobium indicum]|uniref:OmpA-like domain-containing protein n=1 Tax=Novosphingobium indicum TaxID=462949 RepID=A0ABQ2JCQ6_9SPHN|nr:OmpA family protein [Novosphingobium indicum]GGN42671.1 hypothetical protein GCM10011349_06020 [Novosphingobium indicum]